MKVIQQSYSQECVEENEGMDSLVIEVNGKVEFSVSDGSPEDCNLSRNFSDCFGIQSLMEMAYNAGKNGEEFDYQLIEVKE
jgi:hypothetical protein